MKDYIGGYPAIHCNKKYLFQTESRKFNQFYRQIIGVTLKAGTTRRMCFSGQVSRICNIVNSGGRDLTQLSGNDRLQNEEQSMNLSQEEIDILKSEQKSRIFLVVNDSNQLI